MFIDIHAHCYRNHPPFLVQFCRPEQVLERWDAAGIERGVLLPIVSPEMYLPQANEDILWMAETWPERFIPFCNIDPRALTNTADAPLADLLKYYRDLGCKGLGEVMPNLPILDPMVQNLFAAAAEVGLPVTCDGSDQVGGDFGLWDAPGLPGFEKTMQRHPDLLMFGHGPMFWLELGRFEPPPDGNTVLRPKRGQLKRHRPEECPIVAEGVMPRLMREYPNLYGDLSDLNPYLQLSRDPAYGKRFVQRVRRRPLSATTSAATVAVPMVDLLLAGGRRLDQRDGVPADRPGECDSGVGVVTVAVSQPQQRGGAQAGLAGRWTGLGLSGW